MFPFQAKKWIILVLSIILMAFLFMGCGQDSQDGDSDNGGGSGGGVTTPSSVETISLATSKSFVQTDGSDSVTITATLLGAKNEVLSGESVVFSASAGKINVSKVDTDSNGNAQIIFSADGQDKSNQTSNITATSTNGKTSTLPIQITGTTMTIAIDSTEIQSGKSEEITISISDAGNSPVSGAEVSLSQSGNGSVSFTDQSYKTDNNGEVRVNLTGGTSGNLEFKVTALGASAAKNLSVTGSNQSTFKIIDPADESVSKQIDTGNGNEVVTIKVSSPGGKDVKFYTTLGSWKSNNQQSVTISPDGSNNASATLVSTKAGKATITVVEAGSSISDSLLVAITAPGTNAATVTIEALPDVISPSSGDISNSSTLTATVKNSSGEIVSGAPVFFSLKTTTGGGEFIKPAVVFTDSNGQAKTTFTSGTLVSGYEGVKCVATIEKDDGTDIDTDEISIRISGLASSVSIGRATKIQSDSNTEYKYPMSVLVADSNGNPVSGQKVYMSVWPEMGARGVTYDEEITLNEGQPNEMKVGPGPVISGIFSNEDANQNGSLDAGEDGNNNGQLDPGRSTSGIVPTSVTTDDNGVAQFDYIYQKQYSAWVKVRITATTDVSESETKTSLSFWLPYLKDEEKEIPSSPWGP